MIERRSVTLALREALRRSPVVLLAGPRQSGKTTLARTLVDEDSLNYFDLEDPVSLARLAEPLTALRALEGLVVIDEVQHRPDLFPVLRVLVDRREARARFLVLGSASGDLLRQTAESLAGRLEHVVLGGFSLEEVGEATADRLWLRGGLPPSYLAANDRDSVAWRRNYVHALLERDFPRWGVQVSPTALRRFWTMLAHYHGQTWNAAPPARSLGVNESTVRRHLDLMTDAFMIRQLPPYHANLAKRQVKSPKVYVRDSGLLHRLLGVDSQKDLLSHPKAGASWEGFVVEQILMSESYDDAFYWATYQGAGLDLVLSRGSTLLGVECKRVDAPRMTKSIRIALQDLGLARVVVVHPGTRRYPIAERVEAMPLSRLSGGTGLFGEL